MVKQKRKLNVVYFVDSEKTRSFSISLTKLNVILGALALTFCWGIISTAIIYLFSDSYDSIENKLISSKQVIFEYQSRYDKVYEIAYPSQKELVTSKNKLEKETEDNKGVLKESPLIVNKGKKVSDEKVEKPKNVLRKSATKNETKAVVNVPQKTIPIVKEKKNPDKRTVDQFKLVVEEAKIINRNSRYELNFVMRNLHKNKKERGFVWAVAKFVGFDGSTKYLPAPQYTRLDMNGKLLNKKRSHKYSLKNYKKTKFAINIPNNLNGIIENVEIGLFSDDGLLKEFNFPVGVSIGQKPVEKIEVNVSEPVKDEKIKNQPEDSNKNQKKKMKISLNNEEN